jgi:hypothetical protein
MLLLAIKKLFTVVRLVRLKLYFNDLERTSFDLFNRDLSKVKFIPLERQTVEPYLNKIKQFDPVRFIAFNFRLFPEKYAHRLLICLPELLQKLTYNDLIVATQRMAEPMSIISFMNFLQIYCPDLSYKEVLSTARLGKTTKRIVEQHFSKAKPLFPVKKGNTALTKEKIGVEFENLQKAIEGIYKSQLPTIRIL